MKFLCICQYGHSRSVACCRVLHGQGQTAVAAGWSTSGDAIAVLSRWADAICLVSGVDGLTQIPYDQRHKVHNLDVGPDRWSNPYNQELQEILRQKLAAEFPGVLG
jgi:hypothetical protein